MFQLARQDEHVWRAKFEAQQFLMRHVQVDIPRQIGWRREYRVKAIYEIVI